MQVREACKFVPGGGHLEDGISRQQAKVIAVCIAHDIHAYINDHREEYFRFLAEYGYEPDGEQAPRAC